MRTLDDIYFATRVLRRSPGSSLAAILCLALGIGGNAVLLGALDAILYRPPPGVAAAPELVRIRLRASDAQRSARIAPRIAVPDAVDIAHDTATFVSVTAFLTSDAVLRTSSEPEPASVTWVTGPLFQTLGVAPVLGRFFSRDEVRPDATQPVVVLSFSIWQRAFGGARDVLGKTLWIDGKAFTVIGVAPKHFVGANLTRVDAWGPLGSARHSILQGILPSDWIGSRGNEIVEAVARLRPGVTLEQATKRLTTLSHAVGAAEGNSQRGMLTAEPFVQAPELNRAVDVVRYAVIVAALTLLIAIANVSNLAIVRCQARMPDYAMRRALGASKWSLARLVLAELLLLSLLGIVAAVLLAAWAGPVLRTTLVGDALSGTVLSARLVLLACALGFGSAIIAACVPVVAVWRRDLVHIFGARSMTGDPGRAGLLAGIVAAQLALTLSLTVGAGLLVRTLHNLRTVEVGIRPTGLWTVAINVPSTGPSSQELHRSYGVMRERIRTIPGVQGVALALSSPFGTSFGMDVRVPSRDSALRVGGRLPRFNAVTSDYFTVVGTPIRAGRGFANDDTLAGRRVAIVNASLARLAWPNQSAIGQCLVVGLADDACVTVIGVVADSRDQELSGAAPLRVFTPLGGIALTFPSRTLLVRTRASDPLAAAAIRRAAQSVAPGGAVASVRAVDALIDPVIRPWRLGVALFSAFGILGLLLSAVGLYGALSYVIAMRTAEFGVRVALGATRGAIVKLVGAYWLRIAAFGMTFGIVGALAAGRALSAFLFGVAPADPGTLVAAALALAFVALAASVIPTRRALAADPARALRAL